MYVPISYIQLQKCYFIHVTLNLVIKKVNLIAVLLIGGGGGLVIKEKKYFLLKQGGGGSLKAVQ